MVSCLLSEFEFRENVRAFFPQGQRKLCQLKLFCLDIFDQLVGFY